jgi:hypothetical protein
MLNENIVGKMVSLLGEFSRQLLEYSIINTFTLFGPGIMKDELRGHSV